VLRGFYAIVDVKADPCDLAAELARAEALLAARPCVLQLRGKPLGAGALAEVARALLPLCRAAGVPLCVNDRVDVALAVGAEAAHVGQDDLPLAEARRLAAGRSLFLGVSTHDERQARAAADAGADYIGFGPVFGTRTKSNPDPVVGLDGVRRVAAAVAVPVVAIGGITLDNVAGVARAGARAAAVIAAVATATDPTAAGRRVAAAFAEAA
jgi:thiamine-phosphate pyrophosphorylase